MQIYTYTYFNHYIRILLFFPFQKTKISLSQNTCFHFNSNFTKSQYLVYFIFIIKIQNNPT